MQQDFDSHVSFPLEVMGGLGEVGAKHTLKDKVLIFFD